MVYESKDTEGMALSPHILVDERPDLIREIENKAISVPTLYAKAQTLDVLTADASRTALDLFTLAKTLREDIDDMRKKAVTPYRKIVNAVNESAKQHTQILQEVETILKKKLQIWNEYLAESARKAQVDLEKLKNALGIDIEINAPESFQSISSPNASAKTKMEVTFEVQEEKEVPWEYFSIDESKIKKAIEAGIRNIPGIKIIEKQTMTIRRKA